MINTNQKEPAPDVTGLTVLSTEKEVVKLASLWDSRRIVLTFLRHFG